ncbi:bifunctional phosphopantothenoylcysteine decarboxylase/phosphopantothenate--cysteine ligase CoaBC [Luminiphilus sp.]|nr:bifunctional phosphopantothenoylcysteine decarboxylase/phosphopantothenate--cysteine ligase CoaBC [Luminiphilus sp.]MDA8985725.1 bifunctional phosphopantothenoylcysteine decarboxylase/phosphopantothenate--cysteine ligase CoaBC [Luminiphilus sp.]MDB4049264.1 bifunctional phosphopantothenoylcysteine decarboxylase/phosphopantothenate--cysteine ligase CoaBC [Luminiphilus sp.]
MGLLHQRHILVAISGGIAAYKGAELVRLLKKQGAVVRVILSRGAKEFITPLTLQALSGEPTHSELLDETAEAGMGHIELARWADLVVIAPGTADVIARLAQGRADDLLTTVALATPAPVAVAPAMNQQMWANEATQDNLRQLVGRGIQIIGPDAGEQACGDVGPGRLLEPDAIASALAENFESRLLEGKHVVITAGPTVEAIDPVRYLSNHSSGKMGYALARACADAGARVTLITGPVTLTPPNRVDRVPVTSAIEMHDAALRCASNADIFIGAAAVADYRPESSAPEKLKKTAGENRVISLVQNPDIVAAVAALAQRPALVIGFAAETTELIAHAREKRHRKGLDYIVANDVSDPETTFGSDQNAVHLISEHEAHYLPLATKQVIAERIISLVAHHLGSTSPASG